MWVLRLWLPSWGGGLSPNPGRSGARAARRSASRALEVVQLRADPPRPCTITAGAAAGAGGGGRTPRGVSPGSGKVSGGPPPVGGGAPPAPAPPPTPPAGGPPPRPAGPT